MKRWLRITVLAAIIAVLATMLSLGAFASDSAESEVITVKNDTQLRQAFAKIEGGLVSSSCEIRLVNDIDVAGKLSMLTKEFKGVFDGNGKTISGLAKPLFQQFSGTVTDLVIRGEIDATKEDFPDKSNAASFALTASNATASGLVSYVNVQTRAGRMNGGGLFGSVKNKNSFTDCRYYGEYKAELTDSNSALGGIVGWCTPNDQAVTFENCLFGGKITVTGAVADQSAWIGGILGHASQAVVSLKNCTSEGKIVSSITDGEDYVGGILGINDLAANRIEHCVNKSSLTARVNAGGIVGGILENAEISFCANYGEIKADNNGAFCGVANGVVLTCVSSIDFSKTGRFCSTDVEAVNSYASDSLQFEKTFTFGGAEYDQYDLCIINKATGIPAAVLTTDDMFEAYVSIRSDGDKQTIRFVIVTNCDFDTSVTVSIQFKNHNGSVIKSYSGKLGGQNSDLTLYGAVVAGGENYFAKEGCALFGCVITDIPVDVWQSVELTITDTENGKVYLEPVEVVGHTLPLTIESLPNITNFGKIRKVYNCGPGLVSDRYDFTEEDSYLAVFKPILKVKFDAYVESLSDYGYRFVSKTTLDGDDYYTYSKNGSFVYLYYNQKTLTAKIITDNSSDPLSDISYEYEKKDGEHAAFYQYTMNYDNNNVEGYDPIEYAEEVLYSGMMYIIKTHDNKVILVDSGQNSTEASLAGLLDFLREITGTPENEKVDIAAWYFTHAHDDHVTVANHFIEAYHNQVNLHSVIFNFPSYQVINKKYDSGAFLLRDNLQKYFPNVTYHKPHTGEMINFGGVTMEVVYTHEDAVPVSGESDVVHFNCTSTVVKVTMDGKTLMILGDMGAEAEKKIMEMHSSEYLKSDLVQVSHHCYNYLGKLYPAIDADIAVFPQSPYNAKVGNTEKYNLVMKYANEEYFAHKYIYKFVVKNGKLVAEALPRYDRK